MLLHFKVVDNNYIVVTFLDGKILSFSNNKWSDLGSPIDTRINSIVMIDKNEGWCVGDEGNILHYTNSHMNYLTIIFGKDLTKLLCIQLQKLLMMNMELSHKILIMMDSLIYLLAVYMKTTTFI